MTKITVGQLFTAKEIEAAAKLYAECRPGTFNKRVVAQIVQPAMPRINQVTGQENDAHYMGYLLEYLLMKSSEG